MAGHKANAAAKRNRSIYKARDRRNFNKDRKAKKEFKKDIKLLVAGKGIYMGKPPVARSMKGNDFQGYLRWDSKVYGVYTSDNKVFFFDYLVDASLASYERTEDLGHAKIAFIEGIS